MSNLEAAPLKRGQFACFQCDMERSCFLLGLIIFFATTQLNSKVYTQSDSNTSPCNSSSEGDIRLVGGRDMYEGRVEVCDGGEWKTVCDRRWDEREAEVVCRQLGYQNASQAIHVRRGCASQGQGGIIQVEWNCTGDEEKLMNCSVENNTRDCIDHKRDAGVYCSGQSVDNCKRRSVRLVGGQRHNNASGRVEVCRFGCWGTVCDEGWDRYDANVACRQLGFETDKAIPTWGAYFGKGRLSPNRPIVMSQVDCGRNASNESELLNCAHSGINHQCLHNQDAGVICHGLSMCGDGEVRLVDGATESEGRVEMCFNGVWGAVCANGWDDIAADLVCHQLGYMENNSYSLSSEVELGNSLLVFNNISCNGHHSTLLQCVDLNNIGVYHCGGINNTAVGVICEKTESDITLAVVLGTVCGVLGIGAICVALVITLTVAKRKQRRTTIRKGSRSGMGNPTYSEHQETLTLSNLTANNEFEKKVKNPLYSDVTITNTISLDPPQPMRTEANDGEVMKGAASEGVYDHELSPNLDGSTAHGGIDKICYSTLDPKYFSPVEPHLGDPKPEVQCPPSPIDDTLTWSINSNAGYRDEQ